MASEIGGENMTGDRAGRSSPTNGAPGQTVVPPDILNRRSPEPLYQQIRNWIVREMDSGRWPVHYKLPAEDDLARMLEVNRGTLRQALRDLITTGRLTQIHGKGTFVASGQIEQPLAEELITFSEDLLERHIAFRTEVLEQTIVMPPQRIRSLLALPPDSAVFFLKRVRTVQDKPVIVLKNYVVLQRCPDIVKVDFTRHRLFEVLEQMFGLRVDWGRRTFAALGADSETAALLGVPTGEPAMYIEQVVYLDDGSPIELSDVWLPGDRFRLSATVKRGLRHGGASYLGTPTRALGDVIGLGDSGDHASR